MKIKTHQKSKLGKIIKKYENKKSLILFVLSFMVVGLFLLLRTYASTGSIETAMNNQLAASFDRINSDVLKIELPDNNARLTEINLRERSLLALTIASALKTNTYDSSITGVGETEAKQIAIDLVDEVSKRHVGNDPNGWGGDYGHNTGIVSDLALANWLLDKPEKSNMNARRMAQNTANNLILKQPEFTWQVEGKTQSFEHGSARADVIVGDWDGDGIDTLAFREPNSSEIKMLSRNNSEVQRVKIFQYGRATDTLIAGDWDGDGIDTIGVKRGRTYYLRNSNDSGSGEIKFDYGRSDDVPLVGDWNGDGVDTLGIKRGRNYFLTDTHSSKNAQYSFSYGRPDDIVLAHDRNSDGKDGISVYRPSDGVVYIKHGLSQGDANEHFNLEVNSIPLTGKWTAKTYDQFGSRIGSINKLRNSSVILKEQGNSLSEENAWHAQALASALLNMPGHKNAGKWQESYNSYAKAAYSTPQDNLAGWNVGPTGVTINHGVENPDYAAAVQVLWHSGTIMKLANMDDSAAYTNSRLMYDFIKSEYYGKRGKLIYPKESMYTGADPLAKNTNHKNRPEYGFKRHFAYAGLDHHASIMGFSSSAKHRNEHISEVGKQQRQSKSGAIYDLDKIKYLTNGRENITCSEMASVRLEAGSPYRSDYIFCNEFAGRLLSDAILADWAY